MLYIEVWKIKQIRMKVYKHVEFPKSSSQPHLNLLQVLLYKNGVDIQKSYLNSRYLAQQILQ